MLEVNPTAPDPQVEETRLESLLVTGGVSDSTRTAVLQQFEQQRNENQSSAAAMPVMAIADRQKFRARAVTDAERQDQVLAGCCRDDCAAGISGALSTGGNGSDPESPHGRDLSARRGRRAERRSSLS